MHIHTHARTSTPPVRTHMHSYMLQRQAHILPSFGFQSQQKAQRYSSFVLNRFGKSSYIYW